MIFSFTVSSAQGDVYKVSLASGDDAFFASWGAQSLFGEKIEIVEIDLDRIKGDNPTDASVLAQISEGIGRYFIQNEKAVLYYYCDDLNEVPMSKRKDGMWPQEYRSMLFSLMFKRFLIHHSITDIMDITIMVEQGDRPLYMHLIARKVHEKYLDALKDYIMDNYGK